ncbi:MAG: cache domain-containing protein [Kiritimatiellae bacterium]|jgi:CBS domain-containing protein|nr:cache domain-containing protein [Kiritimatiellia bacterium]
MQINQHADRSEVLAGLRAEDIHQWIDGFFNAESFRVFQSKGQRPDYDPYTHRKYRHCVEALEDAYKIFEDRYTRAQIKEVFESHIRDDYQGYIPLQEDFENGTFVEKYHERGGVEEKEAVFSEAELREYFKGASYPESGRSLLSTSFYWRIVWPTVIAAILFVTASFSIILPIFRRNMMEQKRDMIKELTKTAASAISFYVHQEQSGLMTRVSAQSEAASEISELRYGDESKDYFWITDMHPKMIMHPYRPDLSGKDLTNYTDHEDKSGKKLFDEFVKLVKLDGEGYLEYEWQWKDDPSRSAPKLSYVRGISEWNWIIGTGIYIHDVEAEIATLSRNLWVADCLIALILLGILGNLLFQSRRIEQKRSRAEKGLREAKDRYRALVEASGEGSLLEVEGQTVYSNQTIRELTGYSEEELKSMDLLALLAPDEEVNVFAAAQFEKMCAGASTSAEFEAVLQTKKGSTKHIWVSTARIFFSEKQGHVIHFTYLLRSQEDTLRGFNATPSTQASFDGLNQKIRESEAPGDIIRLLGDLPVRLRVLTDQGIRADLLRHIIGLTFDTAIKRFSLLATPPDHPFAVLQLGSSARHEMTLFSDQDSALIFDDVTAEDLVQTRRLMLRFSDELCKRLKQAGWPYCPGGIMAANPKWCLSLSEWKQRFNHWILNATPQSILEVNVFLDIRCAFGESRLVDKLREHILLLTGQNPEFLMHFARNSLLYKAPLTLFGQLKTKQNEGKKTINIKASLKPLETFARIYALKYSLLEVGTCERIQRLQELDLIKDNTAHEICYIIDYLWQLRFYNQLSAEDGLPDFNDEVDINRMNEIERQTLKNVLSQITIIQTKLSYDFLGGVSL